MEARKNPEQAQASQNGSKSPTGHRPRKSNLSINQQSMFPMKSTKKLTEFREFALTPSQSDRMSAYLSPPRLRLLEQRYGISLLGEEDPQKKHD